MFVVSLQLFPTFSLSSLYVHNSRLISPWDVCVDLLLKVKHFQVVPAGISSHLSICFVCNHTACEITVASPSWVESLHYEVSQAKNVQSQGLNH